MRYQCPFCYRVSKDDPHGVTVFDRKLGVTARDWVCSGTAIYIHQCPDCKAIYVDLEKGEHQDDGYLVHGLNGWYRPGDHHPVRYVAHRLLDGLDRLARDLAHWLWRKRMKRMGVL